jgi:hypothetical protein
MKLSGYFVLKRKQISRLSCRLQIVTTTKETSLRKGFTGYTHILVWKVCPKFEGQDTEMMEGIVDATSGEVLSFVDTVDYFQAVGDVYPFSNDKVDAKGSLQDAWPMPFMQIGNTYTDTGGNYALEGSQTARLSGPFVEMRDFCGSSASGDTAELTASGGIDFGGSTGTNCATPGFGTVSCCFSHFITLSTAAIHHIQMQLYIF